MPERIEYAGSVAVVGGPQFSFKRTITSGAYHKLQVEVAHGATQTINLGTSTTSKLKLLAVTSTEYGSEVTFVIDATSSSTAANERELDQPLLIAGMAGIEMIGSTISSLTFKNAFTNKDVVIDVVVVRDPS
jgi:hypothetical protein